MQTAFKKDATEYEANCQIVKFYVFFRTKRDKLIAHFQTDDQSGHIFCSNL